MSTHVHLSWLYTLSWYVPSLCHAVACRALKARTSRAPGTKGQFTLAVSHYLDLPDLERWLVEWREALLSEAGVNWDTEHGGAAILPVFIFDVPSTGNCRL
jgi:hypothetical protein